MNSQEKSKFPDWGIILTWGFLTALSIVMSDGIQAYFIRPNSLLAFLIPGIIIGALQWWYFSRHQITQSSSWLWVTILGWTIGWLVGAVMGGFTNLLLAAINGSLREGDIINAGSSFIGGFVQAVFHSTILAISQWLFFMRKKFNKAIWWIPSTVFGWSISILIGWEIIPVFAKIIGWNESGLEDSAIRGIIFGLITGTAMNWLIVQPLPEIQNSAGGVDNLS